MSGSNGLAANDRRLSWSPSPRQTQHFSPPRAHSPSQRSSESHSAGLSLIHSRPLPPLPSTPPGLLRYTQDDRGPADHPPQPLAHAGARRPRDSLDEGDQTSSAFSDTELLYASAPSSPLRVSAEYSSEDDNATPSRTGVIRQEVHERHAAVAFGTGNFRPSGPCRLSATMDDSDDGVSMGRPTATLTPFNRMNRRWSTMNAPPPVGIGLSEGHKTLPDFPILDIHPDSSILHNTKHPLLTSESRNIHEAEARSFATFPSPGNSTSSENAQAQGSTYPSMPEPQVPFLILGTNLEFEPLPHKSATLPQPSTSSGILNPGSSYLRTHEPLPSSHPYSPSHYVQGFKGAGVASSRSFEFSKHPRNSPCIASGAAAPTPPGSIPSMELPTRRSQDSGANSSRLASPSPTSDKDKDTVYFPKATVSELDASTNMVMKPEIKPIRAATPSPGNKKQIAPAPEASVQQAKHVLSENAADPSATAHDHHSVKVLGSSDTKAPLKVISSNEQKKEDSHRLGAKKLARDGNDAQTTRVQSHSPTVHFGTTSRPLEHRISSQSQPSKLFHPSELPSLPKSSSPPNDSSTTPPHNPPSKTLHTLAEKKAQYNKIPPSSRSQYMNMLLALDDIPTVYNLAASFFTWILLAGFVLFPGTFTSLETLNLGNGFGASLVNRIVNLPVFIVAFTCTGIGIIGMIYLWWKWMKNYIWLVNKIFLPGFMNALAGVISTIVNVYGVQHGEFNTTSIITISVTGGTGLVLGIFTLWYGVFLLGFVKRRHVKGMGIEKAGKHGEGVYSGFSEKVEK